MAARCIMLPFSTTQLESLELPDATTDWEVPHYQLRMIVLKRDGDFGTIIMSLPTCPYT